MGAVAVELEKIVGAESICAWEALEDDARSPILGALAPAESVECIVYPTSAEMLAEVIACAHKNRWPLLPCGASSKLHWGGLTKNIRLVVSTARMNRLVDHAIGDLTITAEAGLRFADLQQTLAQHQQFLALDPTVADRATLGGIMATGDTGGLRQRYGGVRDMVIGLSLVRADGKIAKAGGRVVKNVAGYDLMKLLTGSYGTLGILSQITFRIYPLPVASRTVLLTGEVEAIAHATQALLSSVLTPTVADLLAPATVEHLGLGRQMGLAVRFQSGEASVNTQSETLQKLAEHAGLTVQCFAESDEHTLWQRLQEPIDAHTAEQAIACKIGVLPANAAAALSKINDIAPALTIGRIHAASGLGWLAFTPDSITCDLLHQLRTVCQTQGGYLTVLAAPNALKSSIDLWGYTGNAMGVMKQLKYQFDPQSILNPHRFIGSI